MGRQYRATGPCLLVAGGVDGSYKAAGGRCSLSRARVRGVETTSNREPKRLSVVGAVILEQGRVFCTQRGSGALAGFWEFPGGKVEVGESPEGALAREILEELSCHVSIGNRIVTTTHLYEFAEVTLTTYYCTLLEGHPELSEHQASAWLVPAELHTLEWAPADVPAVEQIQADLA